MLLRGGAIILYISGLFDSKSIVKEVVWRRTTNKGGGVYQSVYKTIMIIIRISSIDSIVNNTFTQEPVGKSARPVSDNGDCKQAYK